MNNDANNQNQPLSDRKTSDRAIILPLVGFLLLTPPLAGIFQLDIKILGIPFTGFYLFTVWAGLIIGAAFLSKRIQRSIDWDNRDGAHSSQEKGKSD